MFLGEDLLAWLMLAFGGALFVGTTLAFVRPPSPAAGETRTRPPLVRSVVMAAVGFVAAVWALITLITG